MYLPCTESWSKKPFFYQELSKITAVSDSGVYIWWRHQKNGDASKKINIFWKHTWWCIYFESKHGGVYILKAHMMVYIFWKRTWWCIYFESTHGGVYILKAHMVVCIFWKHTWWCIYFESTHGGVYILKAHMVVCIITKFRNSQLFSVESFSRVRPMSHFI